MKHDAQTDEKISRMLKDSVRIAVVGMSRDISKAAGQVPRYLMEKGYDIIPVNPYADRICGLRSYDSLLEIEDPLDIINVFRPSDQVVPVVREALVKRPMGIWLQEGIFNNEAVEMARRDGVPIIYNRCIMMEHRRLLR